MNNKAENNIFVNNPEDKNKEVNNKEELHFNHYSESKNANLEKVIECLKNHESKKKEIVDLYDKADLLFNDFDGSIQLCKKYNEAKIHRKYEIIIKDLKDEIHQLTEKLKIEQDARSPNKKYVSDILEKLVTFREENNRLKNEIETLEKSFTQLKEEHSLNTAALQRLQGVKLQSIERLPSLSCTKSVEEAVQNYLQDKAKQRQKYRMEITEFEKNLEEMRPKLWQMSICDLLLKIDKWSEGLKKNSHIDMWRIRSSIARKFSTYIDDSNVLLTPSPSLPPILKSERSMNPLFRRKSFSSALK